MAEEGILAGKLNLLLGVEGGAFLGQLTTLLSKAETLALGSAAKVEASQAVVARSSEASLLRLQAAETRAAAATARVNELLLTQGATSARVLAAQSAAIGARGRFVGLQGEQIAASEAAAARHNRTLGTGVAVAALAAGAAVASFAAAGVRRYEDLTAEARNVERATGATAEASSVLAGILSHQGVDVDAGTTALIRLGRAIEQTPEKLDRYGIAVARNRDGTVDLAGTLTNAGDRFKAIADPAQRAALIFDVFGRGGKALLPVLAASHERIRQIQDDLKAHHEIFTQGDIDRARQLQIASRNLHDAFGGLEIEAARVLVPALTSVANAARDVIEFFDRHQSLRAAAVSFAELGAAALTLAGALKGYRAVRDLLLGARVAEQVGANNAIALSYERVAVAAGEAAVAEGAASRVGGIGGAARVGGLVGGLGRLAGPVAVVAGLGLAAHNFQAGRDQASLDRTLAQFQAHPEQIQPALAQLDQLARSSGFARDATAKLRDGLRALAAGGKDAAIALKDTTEATDQAAHAAAAAAAAASVRGSFSAFEAAPTRRAGAAGSAPLTVAGLLGNVAGQVAYRNQLARDFSLLTKEGVSAPVLAELDRLEKSAPGTVDNLAKTLTRATRDKLNASFRRLDVDAKVISSALDPEFRTAALANANTYYNTLSAEIKLRLAREFGIVLPSTPGAAARYAGGTAAERADRPTQVFTGDIQVTGLTPAELAAYTARQQRLAALHGHPAE